MTLLPLWERLLIGTGGYVLLVGLLFLLFYPRPGRKFYPYVSDGLLWLGTWYRGAWQYEHIPVGSAAWWNWLELHDRFNMYIDYPGAHCLVQKERRGQWYYWYAYRWYHRRHTPIRKYLGVSEKVTHDVLRSCAIELGELARSKRERLDADHKRRRRIQRQLYDRARRSNTVQSASRDGTSVDARTVVDGA